MEYLKKKVSDMTKAEISLLNRNASIRANKESKRQQPPLITLPELTIHQTIHLSNKEIKLEASARNIPADLTLEQKRLEIASNKSY